MELWPEGHTISARSKNWRFAGHSASQTDSAAAVRGGAMPRSGVRDRL